MSQPGSSTKTKELKSVSKQVISPSVLKEDKRKLNLLYIIKALGSISERAIIALLYEASQKGLNLGYEFNVIGNNVFSPSLKEDITSLLYLGYIETDPTNKKIKISSNGEEALEQNKSSIDENFKTQLNQILSELKTKITALDEEYTLKLRSNRRNFYGRR
ncbi:hypothetical protein DFR86_07005 [Acidianus sulfidivorans JP7]|uniref:Uncharacterized protein n=1 Tax=Acidianus sulfidivorans JP7 TaxID=619593 RepID=A0A2U9IMR9_9CREN|nr:hypothetical protein [Acidianus sulfidivorans]AWR97321.1 hypothetical protein DFR86_07005 [Acidianus sulfidivorans JP7]